MSLAEVHGVSLRDLYEATYDDEDYLLFVQAVTQMVVDVRGEMRRDAERRTRK